MIIKLLNEIYSHEIEEEYPFVKFFLAKPLLAEDRAFDPSSKFFNDSEVRIRIEKWCSEIGVKLYPKHSLGYSDCQSLIVFDDGYVPNNSLPIIWAGPNSEADGDLKYTWKPLFARNKVNEPKGKPNISQLTEQAEIEELGYLLLATY